MKTTSRIINLNVFFSVLLTLNVNAADTIKNLPTSKTETAQPGYVRLNMKGKVETDISKARCVRDKKTGLVWESKTDDEGIHDKDNGYRWGGVGAEVDATKENDIAFADWNILVEGTNSEKLCGFTDWRVPTIDELKTLVIASDEKPTIDKQYFPLTLPVPYWSTSAYANYPEHGQTVHFGNGTSYYYNGYRGNPVQIRLVRGELSK